MATTRTSDTHPLWIDEVRAGDAGGLIGITFCPGKCGPSISGYQWERSLSADLDVIAQWAPSAMVTLIEEHEFAMLGTGGRGLVHCRGGRGRAGTVAARILVELGHASADAVDMVRTARPGAIETHAQWNYVMQLTGDASKGAGAVNRGLPTQGGDPHGLV